MGNQLKSPVASTGMLIRKPIAEVFAAIIDPEITTKFWFTKSSGKLEIGRTIEWTWEMYNVTVPVIIKDIEPNKKILIEWGNYQHQTSVEWAFIDLGNKGTYVSIINSGFKGKPDEIIAQVSDSTKGFTFLLSDLKAWMEHSIQLNLTLDAFPKELA